MSSSLHSKMVIWYTQKKRDLKYFRKLPSDELRARSLVVSDLRSEIKGFPFESSC